MFSETLERLCLLLLGPASASDGCSLALVRQTEADLGIQLPRPLRDYYLRFGESKLLGGAHDLLFTPEMLEIEERHLIFWQENQDVYRAGIPIQTLGQTDPPVAQSGLDDEAEWLPECRRLSDFLLRTVCWQALWGMPHKASAANVDAVTFAKLATRVPRIAPSEPYEHELIGHAADGLVACAFPRTATLYLGARDEAQIHELAIAFALQISWL